MAHIHLFPRQFRELQAECRHHPELVQRLKLVDDFAVWIAEAATYCDVVVDAHYGLDEIANLCEILTKRLYHKRTALVITGAATIDTKKELI